MDSINKSNFEEKIATGLVVVDFWAEWCGPCKQMLPVLEKVSNSHTVFKCNVEEDGNKDLARNFGIRSIPTLIFFKDGVEVKRQTGFIGESQLIDILSKL